MPFLAAVFRPEQSDALACSLRCQDRGPVTLTHRHTLSLQVRRNRGLPCTIRCAMCICRPGGKVRPDHVRSSNCNEHAARPLGRRGFWDQPYGRRHVSRISTKQRASRRAACCNKTLTALHICHGHRGDASVAQASECERACHWERDGRRHGWDGGGQRVRHLHGPRRRSRALPAICPHAPRFS